MKLPSIPGRPRKRNRRVGSTESRPGPWRAMLRAAALSAGLLAAFGATFGVVYGFAALKRSERLAVKHLEISGQVRADEAELATFTGVRLGDPILDLDLDATALALRSHPWVRSAQVRRQLPDKVSVTVQEHVPALLVSAGEVYVASLEGTLFLRLSASDRLVFPVLTGLSREDIVRRPEEARQRVQQAIALVAECDTALGAIGRLDELHWDADLGWSVVLSPGGDEQIAARLHLGKQPVERLPVARRALERLAARGEHPAALWVDGQKHPDRVHAQLHSTFASPEPSTFVAIAK